MSFSWKCPFHSFSLGFVAAAGLFMLARRLKNERRRTKGGKDVPSSSGSVAALLPRELHRCPYTRELLVAIGAALEAGANIRSALDAANKRVLNKGDADGIDFVTDTDQKNEQLVFERLKLAFPAHEFIGEETSADAGGVPPLTAAPTWICDPIDGTTNFVHAFPFTCVSIALAVDMKPVVAVVYDPTADELFLAVRGLGAFLNGQRIQVSSANRIRSALVLTETGYQRGSVQLDTIFRCLRAVVDKGPHSIRILGSCVLDLCYVACGRLDAMYLGVAGEGGKIWDYAAGALVVLEAGGFVSDVVGNLGSDLILTSESILAASTAELQVEMVGTLAAAVSEVPPRAPATKAEVPGPLSPFTKLFSMESSLFNSAGNPPKE